MALASPVEYAGTITSTQRHNSRFGLPGCNRLQCIRYDKKSRASCQMVVRAIFQDRPQLDFSNPNWKKQFQEEFDRRFSLPHLTDVIDVESRPTTFSLKSRWDVLPSISSSNSFSFIYTVGDRNRSLYDCCDVSLVHNQNSSREC
jgi:6-phosphofructokinase 1